MARATCPPTRPSGLSGEERHFLEQQLQAAADDDDDGRRSMTPTTPSWRSSITGAETRRRHSASSLRGVIGPMVGKCTTFVKWERACKAEQTTRRSYYGGRDLALKLLGGATSGGRDVTRLTSLPRQRRLELAADPVMGMRGRVVPSAVQRWWEPHQVLVNG